MSGKRICSIILVAIVAIVFAAPASWAGTPAQHRLEGVAIGIGALILTKVIIDHQRYEAVAVSPTARRYHHRPRRGPAGYWEIQKTWVPATYKKVRHPGHYNRCGRWIPGRWLEIEVEPGHWSKRRVWVPYR